MLSLLNLELYQIMMNKPVSIGGSQALRPSRIRLRRTALRGADAPNQSDLVLYGIQWGWRHERQTRSACLAKVPPRRDDGGR